MAYGQEGLAARPLYTAPVGPTKATDAQTVENMRDDPNSSWQKRFLALGLKLPKTIKKGTPELDVFTWWQDQAGLGKYLTTDVDELQDVCPIRNRDQLKKVLYNLIDDGIVYYKHFAEGDRSKGAENIGLKGLGGAKSLRLKKEYIPTDMKSFRAATQDLAQGGGGSYAKKAATATYADYHKFINHSYLQLATNVLHDHFCKHGLWVNTSAGTTGYKIYGDNAMLGAQSQKMVEYSAETSHMSRNSIYDLADTGTTANTTAAIAARIPRYVSEVDGGTTVSLEEWHEEDKGKGLKKLCWNHVFPDKVAAVASKSTFVAAGNLAPQVSGDVESGEPF
jgi:hypothetical protein